MSAIYEEFERELGRLRARYARTPRRELRQLFLIALEREEIVSVAYRERAIADRLARMPLDDAARELIRHALLWCWKDEEMHTIYVRGAIFRSGGFVLRTVAYLHQLAGAIGGWAASVRQHGRWRDAPVSRAAATLVTFLGAITGKVPREVARKLEYGPFRRFCEYNVDAERTAACCWSRIVELSAGDPALAPLIRDFERIAADEVRHQRIFEILVSSLTDDDALASGTTAERLAGQIEAVGDAFLPRSMRAGAASNPLGSNAAVHVMVGGSVSEKRTVLRRLLADLRLEERVRGVRSVAIKPTFMLGYDRGDRSMITDPELLDELASALREMGCTDVTAVEGPNIYDHFYANRSVASVARYLGYESPHYRIVDASQEQVPHRYSRGLAQTTVARTWRDAEFRISFPKMRSHPIELVYLAVPNVEWIGGRCDEYLFCERQAQRETAIMMLLDDFPPHLALIDAYEQAADGLIGAMGCARPPSPLRIYGGYDALAVDIVAARHLGIRELRDGSVLRAATHWFGGGTAAVIVAGCDEPVKGWRGPYSNELWALLSVLAYPVYVVGSGRGALFVPEMDEAAFPPLEHEGRWLRLARAATRRLIGLHRAA